MIEAIRICMDDLKEELLQEIVAAGATGTTITRSERVAESDELSEGLIWWRGSRGGELNWTLFVGGRAKAWEAFGFGGGSGTPAEGASARFGRCLEKTLERKFGPSRLEGDCGWTQPPIGCGTRIILSLVSEDASSSQLHCCFSRELENAIGREIAPAFEEPSTFEEPSIGLESPERSVDSSGISLNVLMDVEVPVRVSFGRTKVRMGELLGMSPGAVIELDQALGDHVDVLVNNCVIARGEVVAIDGNYGVRILDTTPSAGKLLEETK